MDFDMTKIMSQDPGESPNFKKIASSCSTPEILFRVLRQLGVECTTSNAKTLFESCREVE